MTRPKGNCGIRNECDGCCPWTDDKRAAGKWNTIQVAFNFPALGWSGTYTLDHDQQVFGSSLVPVDLQDDAELACVPDQCGCTVPCSCFYRWYVLGLPTPTLCDTPPTVVCSDHPIYDNCRLGVITFACDPSTSNSFQVLVCFTDKDNCNSSCIYDGVNPVNCVRGVLNTDTLVCQCPDDLYAQFGPPITGIVSGFPDFTFDPDGTITVTGVDDDTKGCPDTFPCPEHPYIPQVLVVKVDNLILTPEFGPPFSSNQQCSFLCKRQGLPGYMGGLDAGFPTQLAVFLTDDDPPVLQLRMFFDIDDPGSIHSVYLGTVTSTSTSGEGDWHIFFDDPIIISFADGASNYTLELDGLQIIPCPCDLL